MCNRKNFVKNDYNKDCDLLIETTSQSHLELLFEYLP